jgi:hypothetical protein
VNTFFRGVSAVVVALLGGAVACSGSSDDGGSGGSGGTGKAGSGAVAGTDTTGGTGGSGGSALTGGAGGASGGTAGTAPGGRGGSGGSGVAGTGVCCNAFPTCGPDEREVPTAADCARLPMCHEVSLCCSTIYCSVLTPGSGGSGGAGGASGTGGAAGASGACNPEMEPDRNYVGESRAECMVVRFQCPEYTTMFSNDCGCGCEQDASCPDFVDCMPGSDPKPGCSEEERARCPYTDIAL